MRTRVGWWAAGALVRSDLDDRVVGVAPDVLHAVPRRIGLAGGPGQHTAVRAALLGGWVNVLVTDLGTAEYLLAPVG